MNFILPLMVALPAVAALAIAFGMPPRRTALFAVNLNLILGILLAIQFPVNEVGYHFQFILPCFELNALNLTPGSIPASINLHFGVDGINLAMLLAATFVSSAAIGLSDVNIHRAREYFICMLLICMGAVGAFASLDLFMLYLFHEIALIPTFILIGVWGSGHRQHHATQMTIYLGIASLILLAGFIGAYVSMGDRISSFDLTELRRSIVPQTTGSITSYLFILAGLGILAALWPFHSWAPNGYASAPAPVAMLHAGLLKKLAIYTLLRLSITLLPQGAAPYLHLLFWLLLGNLLYIGWVTLRQKDLGLLAGFSSVMHIGYLFLGIAALISLSIPVRGSFGSIAIGSLPSYGLDYWISGLKTKIHSGLDSILVAGIILLTVAHSFGTALIFALSGEIKKRTNTLQLDELGGLASVMPRLCTLFIIAAMASIGLPGLAMFPGELLILLGSWQISPTFTLAALFGIVLSAIYMLRAVRSIFFGPLQHSFSVAKDLNFQAFWPCLILTLPLILLGIYPQLLIQWIQPSLRGLLGY